MSSPLAKIKNHRAEKSTLSNKPLVVMMSMMRQGLAGGPAQHLPYLKAGLEEQGIKIIPFNYTRRYDKESRSDKILGRGYDLFRACYLILKHRPSLVHHNSAFVEGAMIRDGLLCLFARILRTPIFIKAHGSFRSAFEKVSFLQSVTRFLTLRLATGLGVLSEPEREEFIARWPALALKIFVVKNIVRDEFLHASVRSYDLKMVYFTSRFVKEKGMFELLDAIPLVLAMEPECRFTFIGDGPDAEEFQKKIADRGLQNSVAYLSHKSHQDLIKLYEEGGIFVFPTQFPEGMPMSLVEAMAVGMLVVSSKIRFVWNIPSFRDYPILLLENKHPLPAQIAQALVSTINDVAFRKTVGLANKSFIKNYSKASVSEEFVQLYHLLLAKK